jgi:hypothetical protein
MKRMSKTDPTVKGIWNTVRSLMVVAYILCTLFSNNADTTIRVYPKINNQMRKVGFAATEQTDINKKVVCYIILKETIGNTSYGLIELQSNDVDMRRLISTCIISGDSRKIGEFVDFTLPNFVLTQGEELCGKGTKAVVETIENNILIKVVDKIFVNPK